MDETVNSTASPHHSEIERISSIFISAGRTPGLARDSVVCHENSFHPLVRDFCRPCGAGFLFTHVLGNLFQLKTAEYLPMALPPIPCE
jgi:hypothetical protein